MRSPRTFFGGTALQDTEERIRDLEKRHQSELNSLWVDQLQIRGVIAGVWFAICLSLYFCGWVIGWIAQGFRPKRV